MRHEDKLKRMEAKITVGAFLCWQLLSLSNRFVNFFLLLLASQCFACVCVCACAFMRVCVILCGWRGRVLQA